MSAVRVNPLLGRVAPAVTPVRGGGVTGRAGEFGMTRVDEGGRPKEHKGLDLLCVVAWPVFACHDGIVSVAGWENPADPSQGYGQRVKVESVGYRLRTVYAHLSLIIVKQSAKVTAGDLIGLSGRTGNVGVASSIPSHLHFEVQVGDGSGNVWTPIDPALWLMGADQDDPSLHT